MDKKLKFLIVDDEEIVLRSCIKILTDPDFIIDTAYSGETALSELEKKSGQYDIVLTDLMMPGMGGMELLKNIIRNYPHIAVVIFTGFATVESVREALKLGAFDYIPKPFTPDELRKVVYNVIESRKNNKEAKMLDLMAIVSHDLKSPIAVVHTNAETLCQGYFGDLDEKQKKSVEAIIRNCVYLEDIIRSYMDLSQLDDDSLGSLKKKVNFVDDIIQPVIDIPEHQANIRKMSIAADYKVRPDVMADPDLLKIVVTNLLSNAIKYGKNDTEIQISLSKENGFYIFKIRNEGVGFTQDDIRNKLFKKYNRLKQKGTEGIKGNGLGLYICRTIVEKHNGVISAESETGKWVSFSFTIPAIDS